MVFNIKTVYWNNDFTPIIFTPKQNKDQIAKKREFDSLAQNPKLYQ